MNLILKENKRLPSINGKPLVFFQAGKPDWNLFETAFWLNITLL
jgi:hypothetical protein